MQVVTRLALTAAFSVIIAAPVLAQSQQDQAACRSDAIKHCSSFAGKQTEMRQCLAKNKDKLSAACKAVVEKAGG